MTELEKLIKKTEYKKDAAVIAQKLEKFGLTIDTFSDAPRFFKPLLYGYDVYQVIAAMHEAKALPDEEPKTTNLKTKELPPANKPADPEPEV